MAFWMCLSENPISSSGVAIGGGKGGRGVRGGEGEWLLAMGGSGALWGVRGPTERPLEGLWVVRDDWEAECIECTSPPGWLAGAQGTVIGRPREGIGRLGALTSVPVVGSSVMILCGLSVASTIWKRFYKSKPVQTNEFLDKWSK